mgnify:CR=1 FL=1
MHQGFKRTAACILASLLLSGAAAVTAAALEPSGNGVKVRNWLTRKSYSTEKIKLNFEKKFLFEKYHLIRCSFLQ